MQNEDKVSISGLIYKNSKALVGKVVKEKY
jgi:hypothetical protein